MEAMAGESFSLYIHIPFCRVRCPYCDFNAYARLEGLIPSYVDALLREMELRAPLAAGMTAVTLYFGGGTPSLLPLGELERILRGVAHHFRLAPDVEVSLEANPGTVDLPYLQALRALGINRLSLGVQSFREGDLRFLGRDHTVEEARRACQAARRAGFTNLNLDLIYGLPHQSMEGWRATLEEALSLAPEHLSLYPLSVEERTPLHRWVERGQVPAPDPDLTAAMYEWAEGRLEAAGYEHYEISNWARPGHRCRHNLTYWHNEPYLGLGAGAHSSFLGFRFANVASPRQYIRRMEEVDPARPSLPSGPLAELLPLDPSREMAETAILALRLGEGLDGRAFQRRFGLPPEEVWGPQIRELAAAGLLDVGNGRLRLTPRGRLLANEVFLRFLPPDDRQEGSGPRGP